MSVLLALWGTLSPFKVSHMPPCFLTFPSAAWLCQSAQMGPGFSCLFKLIIAFSGLDTHLLPEHVRFGVSRPQAVQQLMMFTVLYHYD